VDRPGQDYADIDRPVVRLATAAEASTQDLSFFASTSALPAHAPLQRVGVIGCGAVAARGALPGFAAPGSAEAGLGAHFLAFNGAPAMRVIGVADVDADRAAQAADRFGVHHIMPDGDRLMDEVPVDAVCVCTPPAYHASLAMRALGLGLHVLLEKPAASSMSELDDLLAVRRDNPELAVVVNLPWFYHPAVDRLRRVVTCGELGEVDAVSVVFEHSGPQGWSPGAAWYWDPAGAGVVADLGGHVLTTQPAIAVNDRIPATTAAAASVATGCTRAWSERPSDTDANSSTRSTQSAEPITPPASPATTSATKPDPRRERPNGRAQHSGGTISRQRDSDR
jgi:predicted dehydrogenase